MSMIWPIALVVFSNIVYQICAKGVPKNMDAMASMTLTTPTGLPARVVRMTSAKTLRWRFL